MKKITHSGNLILTGFAIMILMMSFLVYSAIKHPVSMVSKNYYEQELTYQQKIDAMHNSAVLDDQFKVEKTADLLRVDVPVNIAQILDSGSITLYCPSAESGDKNFSIKKNDSGSYTIDRKNWKRTAYILKVSLYAPGKNYYKEFPIVL